MSTPTCYPTIPEASNAPHVAESATLEGRRAYLEQVLPSYRSQVEPAFAKAASPRKSIAAKCLDCHGFLRDGGVE